MIERNQGLQELVLAYTGEGGGGSVGEIMGALQGRTHCSSPTSPPPCYSGGMGAKGIHHCTCIHAPGPWPSLTPPPPPPSPPLSFRPEQLWRRRGDGGCFAQRVIAAP